MLPSRRRRHSGFFSCGACVYVVSVPGSGVMDHDAQRAKWRESAARYRATHKEAIRERRREIGENPEKKRARAARYRRKHAARAVDRTREWRDANRDRCRAHTRACNQRRRARLRGNAAPGVSPAQWDRVRAWWAGLCAYCLRRTGMTIDHVVAISRGGADSVRNVVPACGSCNASKGGRAVTCAWLQGRCVA